MDTDYLLLVSGIVRGSGGVLDLIAERYTISAAEELGISASLRLSRCVSPASKPRILAGRATRMPHTTDKHGSGGQPQSL
jgi:hypothetical protein